jgi:hypothetical protein
MASNFVISAAVVNRNFEQSWRTIKTLASLFNPNISSLIKNILPAQPHRIPEFTDARAAVMKLSQPKGSRFPFKTIINTPSNLAP